MKENIKASIGFTLAGPVLFVVPSIRKFRCKEFATQDL